MKASNGLAAMKLVEDRIRQAFIEKHDCNILKAIVMDFQMPIMDGKESSIYIGKLCEEH
jgi:CheY-like chemotaxis protein